MKPPVETSTSFSWQRSLIWRTIFFGIKEKEPPPNFRESTAPLKAIAVLHPTEGNKVSGTVTFTEVADGVQVEAAIAGLTPGKHGFHIHEFGDCSAADASSAGAHFNPTNQPHAAPDAEA